MRQFQHKRAFTLVEILIVVVIMGILAAIVIPQFSQSSDDARFSATVQNLQSMRAQIDLYRNQHKNKLPGSAAAANPDTKFAEQMTLPSNATGDKSTNADQGFGDRVNFPYGPYITNQVPANPFTGSRDVQSLDTFPATAPGGTSGWVFELKSGRLKINWDGNAPDGTSYWSL